MVGLAETGPPAVARSFWTIRSSRRTSFSAEDSSSSLRHRFTRPYRPRTNGKRVETERPQTRHHGRFHARR
jgi:hypothetical protein